MASLSGLFGRRPSLHTTRPNAQARGLRARAWARLRESDWRVWTVVIAVLLCLIATGIIYKLRLGQDPATHFGAVFAGWVSGFALFILIGFVVAVVSLARPEEESFDARARILFRRQSGNHINYIVGRIKDILEQYAEHQVILLKINRYHATDKKFHVSIYNKTLIRSYIDDIFSEYRSPFEYTKVTLPPANESPNTLLYIRTLGEVVQPRMEFKDEVRHEIHTTVPPKENSEVEFEIEMWVEAEKEPNTQMTVRYTQLFEMQVANVSDKPVKIHMQRFGNNDWVDEVIRPGQQAKTILTLQDVPPTSIAVDFRVLEA